MTDYLTTDAGRRIAYERLEGQGPGVVFLGGFRSDMQGSKAVHLRNWAAAQGRAFLRFDYSGHGVSDGAFEDGCIADWAADARAAIGALTDGPQVLVGSSMGGWISLLMARAVPDRVAGLVTIAAAPDFTERGFWASFSAEQRRVLAHEGHVALPSEYGEPLILTRRLIEDGRQQLVLDRPLDLPFPVRMLQGTADDDVPVSWAMDLLDHVTGEDVRLTLVKGADHRFSSPECLGLIVATIGEVVQNVRV